MLFNKYSNLVGQHALFSASKYHWINYDDEKVVRAFNNGVAAQRGTDLHALAAEAIRLKVKLSGKTTISQYVNDAIGYRMSPEQVLFYSVNFFGTADAISFRRNTLRIHDLKNGIGRTSEHQLEVYAALFCLEYRHKPHEIEIELRIYQNNEIQVFKPDPDFIVHVMDKIKTLDQRVEELKKEAES